jgi:hypothetical protein
MIQQAANHVFEGTGKTARIQVRDFVIHPIDFLPRMVQKYTFVAIWQAVSQGPTRHGSESRQPDDRLCLHVRLHTQSQGRYEFVLAVRNEAAARLLIPLPEITGLRFRRRGDEREAEWRTFSFQTSNWAGMTLEPSEVREVNLKVVTCTARRPPTEQEIMLGRDDRWCIDLQPGTYDVAYRLRVDDFYFDPDSHYRLSQVRKIAASKAAEAWIGEAVSNEIRLVHV